MFHSGAIPYATVRHYPSLHEFENKSMEDHPLLFAAAKLFSPIGVREFDDIRHEFADAVGLLPGNLPVQAISPFDLCSRIFIPPSILRHTGPRGRSEL